jgi:hypothetical protein
VLCNFFSLVTLTILAGCVTTRRSIHVRNIGCFPFTSCFS